MIAWTVQLQPVFVGAVLLLAGTVKVTGRRAAAVPIALRRMVGDQHATAMYRAVGIGEVAVGVLLLVPAPVPVPAGPLAATVFSGGFLGYLGYARATAPGSPCGCMSGHPAPITWRSFARAGMLLGSSLAATQARGFWADAAAKRPIPAVAVLIVQAAALVALSAELDPLWLARLRRLNTRIHRAVSRTTLDVPLTSTLRQLRRSDAYRRVRTLLRPGVQDSWDEGEWRIVCYAARYHDRPTTAVFAVPRLRYDPDAVRLALVDEADSAIRLTVRP